MAITFPLSPQIGETYLAENGTIYTWTGVKWSAALIVQNSSTFVGPSGPQGPGSIVPGPQGDLGYTGSAGTDGAAGYTGSAGPGANQYLNTFNSVTFANLTVTNTASVGGVIYQGVAYNGVEVPGTTIRIDSNYSGYTQQLIKNYSSESTSTSDIMILNDLGDANAATNLLDIGINNSNYTEPAYGIHTPGSAYMFTNGVDLILGTQTAGKKLVFHAGGSDSINSVGYFDESAWHINRTLYIEDKESNNLSVLIQNINTSSGAKAGISLVNDSGSYFNMGIGSTVDGSDPFIIVEGLGNNFNIGAQQSINFYADKVQYNFGVPVLRLDNTDYSATFRGHLLPVSDLEQDLGSLTQQWRSLYVGTGTIYINGVPLTIDTSTNTLIVGSKTPSTSTSLATESFVIDYVGQHIVNGYTGSKGETGYTGYTGSQGAQGEMGYRGYTGSAGLQGSQGDQGPSGAQGEMGYRGYTGSAGPTGAAGPKGDTGGQGISVTLIGSTSTSAGLPLTGNPGDGWIVTDTSNLWFWNTINSQWNEIGPIVGPQGDPGYIGSQGVAGDIGLQGDPGYTGSRGLAGYVGSQGATGDAGLQGDLGYTGSQGDIGYTGYTGSAGSDGAMGYTGSAGSDGAMGYTGSAGSDGDIGYTGSQGDIGYTGSAGFTTTNQLINGLYTVSLETDGILKIPGSIHSDNGTDITVGISPLVPNVSVDAADSFGPGVWRLFILDSVYPTIGTTVKVGASVTVSWGSMVTATVTDIIHDIGYGRWVFIVDQNVVPGFSNGLTVTFGPGYTTWSFDANGKLTLPNGTAIGSFDTPNGIDIKAFAEHDYAELNYNEDNFVWVDTAGAYIATNWTATQHTWTFAKDGIMSTPGHLIPNADLTYDLGSPTAQWRSVYVGTGTVYIGGVAIGVSQDNYVTVDGNPIVTINTAGNLSLQGDTVLTPVAVMNTAPPATVDGQLWYNTLDGRTYVAYSGTWVDTSPVVVPSPETYLGNITVDGDTLNINGSTLTISNTGTLLINGTMVTGSGGGGNIYGATLTASATDPMTSTGTLWFNTVEGRTYLKYNDQWVDVNPTVVPLPSTYLDEITIDGSTINMNGSTLYINTAGTLLVNGQEITGAGTHMEYTDTATGYTSTLDLTYDFLVDLDKSHADFYGAGDWDIGSNFNNTKIFTSQWQGGPPQLLTVMAGNTSWTFDPDGALTLPEAGTIQGAGTGSTVTILASDGTTSSSWVFGADGTIALPNGGTILNPAFPNVTSIENTSGVLLLGGTGNGLSVGSAGNSSTLSVNNKNWVFDTAGVLTLPEGGYVVQQALPAFRVYGANSTNITVGVALTATNFVVDYNQGSHLNTTTGIFTAPVAGLYQINLVARAYSNAGIASQIAVVKNPSGSSSVMCMIEWAANTTVNHLGASTTAKLAAGDTLQTKVLLGTAQFDSNDSWSVAFLG